MAFEWNKYINIYRKLPIKCHFKLYIQFTVTFKTQYSGSLMSVTSEPNIFSSQRDNCSINPLVGCMFCRHFFKWL